MELFLALGLIGALIFNNVAGVAYGKKQCERAHVAKVAQVKKHK